MSDDVSNLLDARLGSRHQSESIFDMVIESAINVGEKLGLEEECIAQRIFGSKCPFALLNQSVANQLCQRSSCGSQDQTGPSHGHQL